MKPILKQTSIRVPEHLLMRMKLFTIKKSINMNTAWAAALQTYLDLGGADPLSAEDFEELRRQQIDG
jgi:hypothetical protein